MTETERLIAIEEIKLIRARYFLGVDTKDWDLLRDYVFWEDAHFHLPEMGGDGVAGRDAILAFFKQTLTPWTTVHHGHTPIIEITSDTTATGLWAMEDRIFGSPGEDISSIHGFGHYHDNYVRLDRGWRLGVFTLTRLRVETGRIY
jgi:hypothetical protein